MSEMKAGRELDALVAERVMGWTDVKLAKRPELGVLGRHPVRHAQEIVPHYSTDIAAAMAVVEELRSWIFWVQRVEAPLGQVRYSARVYTRDKDVPYYFGAYYDATANTAPLAICLAALKAVGVEVNIDEWGKPEEPRR